MRPTQQLKAGHAAAKQPVAPVDVMAGAHEAYQQRHLVAHWKCGGEVFAGQKSSAGLVTELGTRKGPHWRPRYASGGGMQAFRAITGPHRSVKSFKNLVLQGKLRQGKKDP